MIRRAFWRPLAVGALVLFLVVLLLSLAGCAVFEPSTVTRREWLTVCVTDWTTGASRCTQRQCIVNLERGTYDCLNRPERPCVDPATGRDRCAVATARQENGDA